MTKTLFSLFPLKAVTGMDSVFPCIRHRSIVTAVFNSLKHFTGNAEQSDDITMVVIKVEAQ
ncbi:hypothetical protein ACFL0Q_08280 [Thermodesulfobacteriota bacterium]